MGKQTNQSAYFYRRLKSHLDAKPETLAVISQKFENYQRPNLHLAMEELLAKKGTSFKLDGVIVDRAYDEISLAKFSRESSAKHYLDGPVEYEDVEMPEDARLACVKRGIYWVTIRDATLAVLVQPTQSFPPSIEVEVMSADRDVAQDFSRQITRLVSQAKAFRGRVLSLEMDCYHSLVVRYHALPSIQREDVVLPDETLRRLERHTVGFVKHGERLRSAGRHIKRGILLYGPPGTGKTLSAMHVASQMAGRTVLILTGGGIQAIEASGRFARSVQPATIILEDVDLIGTERAHQTVGANALLFELLNQMDGLAEDADVLFILTTNRPDILEPALASRPGRIDQAIEIPVPDADCRRKLLGLYSRRMNLKLTDLNVIISRTQGVSAAFIRELLRKALLFALEQSSEDASGDGDATVRDRHVLQALDELLTLSGPLTPQLLGTVPKAQ